MAMSVTDEQQRPVDAGAVAVEPAASNVLPGFWLVREDASLGASLRLSKDERGEQLCLCAAEAAMRRTRLPEAEPARRQG